MGLAQDYLKKIEKHLGELGNKIDDLNLKVKTEAKAKYEETRSSLNSHLDESLEKAGQDIEAQVKEWGKKIEELKGKGRDEAKKEYNEVINNIRPKIDEFNEALKELKQSGGDALGEVGSGARAALKELKDSFSRAKGKFR